MRNLFTRPKTIKWSPLSPAKALFWGLFVVAGWLLGLQNCDYQIVEEPAEYQKATEVALAWNQLALDLERHTLGYRPPVSARMFAYVELAAYEASLPALPNYVSMEAFISGYQKPAQKFSDEEFYLPASLNTAYAEMLRHFFPTTPNQMQHQIDRLEKDLASDFFAGAKDGDMLARSAGFGKLVAQSVWDWSKTDREGHDAYLYNYDHSYTPPDCKGCWQPIGEHPKPALLPYWGRVRPFIAEPEEVPVKSPFQYEVSPGSNFYTEAMEVYSVSKPLSKENHWIAEFWSDDFAGLTCSPSGRWISIANQAFEKARPPFPLVMETYLKTSMAICDAGILVWKSKYEFNVERPQAFINQQINPQWEALHDTPPFPAYPSGHAAFGAAAAEVLSDALGQKFEMTDRTHEKRPEFASTPRTYNSFMEMAQENAASRVLLGVHYRMDCVEGMRMGKIIGRKIADLPLLRKEASVLGR